MRIHPLLIPFLFCLPVTGMADPCASGGCAPNEAPVANAGPDQVVLPGALVTLNGSGSSDPDGDALRFRWSMRERPAGSHAELDATKSVMPQFYADLPGRYVFDLVVYDPREFSGRDSVVVTTGDDINTPPVADAGADQRAQVGETIGLDGSASSDVDGDALSYWWNLVSLPAGSQAALSDPASVRPSLVPDLPGTYLASLTVVDGRGGSSSDTVEVETLIGNRAPLANAGADQSSPAGSAVVLDGSGSSDPDGDALQFHWSFVSRPNGSIAALDSARAIAPRFVVDRAGDYLLQLIVSDGTLDSAADTVLVTSDNTPPVADAGDDVQATPGQHVLLDGNGSSDANGDPLAFTWSLLSRPPASTAALNDAFSPTPGITVDATGLYVLQLIVNDGAMDSLPDSVSIEVPAPPNADPTALVDEVSTAFETSVLVDVLANDSDPDGDAITISDVAAPRAGTAAVEGDSIRYTPNAGYSGPDFFSYTISDGNGGSATASVFVTVGVAPGTVSVVTSDSTAGELGPESGAFTLSRTGSTAEPLTVAFTLLGTAVNGTDYELLPTSVTIPAGASSATVTVTPIPDALNEGAESVLLLLGPGSGYGVGSPGLGSLSIADSVVVSVTAVDAAASEVDLDPASFEITRTGDMTRSLLVAVSVTGAVNALNSNDAVISGIVGGSLVTIPAGSATARITVTPVRDNRAEGNEDLVITVVRGSAYVVGVGSATINLADDPVIVTVIASDAQATESTLDPGTFTFSRTGGDVNGAISVRCTFTGGTAAPSLDFTPGSCGLTIPAGASSATLNIVPRTDTNNNEGSETVVATVTASNIAAYLVGTPSQATVTIIP